MVIGEIVKRLPIIKGTYRELSDLSKVNWFRVGGMADVLFKPYDVEDLAYFLQNKPEDIDVTIMGVGSNIIVGDKGIRGVVVKLGRNFAEIKINGEFVEVGAGALDSNVAKVAADAGIGGLEFLSVIPGTIGGALAMNAGAYGVETSDILVEAQVIDPDGNIHNLKSDELGFTYRKNKLPESWIFVKAIFRGVKAVPKDILQKMEDLSRRKEEAQPVRIRTGGSTFKNPNPEISGGKSAWQLIDEAGCRGLKIGGAKVSEKHCNFLENTGDATAEDIINLGEEVRRRVKEKSGIELMWEIKHIGE